MLVLSFQFFIVFCCSTLIYSIATDLLQGAIKGKASCYFCLVMHRWFVKHKLSNSTVELQQKYKVESTLLIRFSWSFLKHRRQFFKVTKSESTKEEDFLCGRYPNRTSSCSINKRKSVIVRRNIRNYRNVALVHGNVRKAGLLGMARRQILQ